MATVTRVIVAMDEHGRLTLPPEMLRELGVEGEAAVAIRARDGSLIIEPAGAATDQDQTELDAIPEEDRWLYTPENVARIKEAMALPPDQDVQLTYEELERLIARANG